MHDIHSELSPAILIAPAALSADTSAVEVDLQGYDAAMIEIVVGVGGITFTTTNKVEFKLTHGDTSGSLEAVTDADVKLPSGSVGAGGIVKSLTAAHAAASVTKIGYLGGKRYIALVADFGGTHAAPTPMAATAVRGKPLRAPV